MDEILLNSRLAVLSDDELVERAQVRPAGGGEISVEAWEAWVVLYVRYNDRILNAILGYLGNPQLESVAVDLTDGTFTKAFDALPKKKKGSPFVAWLRAIARNETWKWFRQHTTSLQGYMERRAAQQLPEEDPGWVSPVGARLEQPADIELREAIELAKNTLSDKEYHIFVLRYEEGLEVEEIARKLGAKPKTVQMALWRATTRFKVFYEGPRPSTRQNKRNKASDGSPPSGETQPQPAPQQRKEGRQHG
ncbi:MAG TPA: sigma-70 family RNA polymerase sigma factor [Ktedonobacterales bacterium]|nr:sigma-70 family RNA polymerase sigma factor [Ktedonobacterales bacterium]